MNGRQIRFIVELPDKNARAFTHTPGRNSRRDASRAYAAWEKACRQRWRALALVIKAKLEAVETGITVFEDEFMAHIVLPDGQTVGEYIRPQIAAAYQSGSMPQLMPYTASSRKASCPPCASAAGPCASRKPRSTAFLKAGSWIRTKISSDPPASMAGCGGANAPLWSRALNGSDGNPGSLCFRR